MSVGAAGAARTDSHAGDPARRIGAAGAGATRHVIGAGDSLIAFIVLRGGTLAAFGHNHVIAARSMAGVIDVQEPLTSSRFELHLPVAGFTVDEPQLRAGRGPGFESVVPDAARDGTRRNMLGADLLDAAQFPEIVVRAVSLEGGPLDFAARLAIEVRGTRHTIVVPVRLLRLSAALVQVSARFPVDQTALGLTPFTAMLGALRVEDTLTVEVALTARRVP